MNQVESATSKSVRQPGVLPRAAVGASLGILIAGGLGSLGVGAIPFAGVLLGPLVSAPAGALLYLRPLGRRTLYACALTTVAAGLIVSLTPLSGALIRTLVRQDLLERADAVVALAADPMRDGALSSAGQERAVHAYELLRMGYAPVLVLTHPTEETGDWIPGVRSQMDRLGIRYPVIDCGRIAHTNDEARRVADLARARHWSRVILVTHPWHMRRASLAFARAGVRVICSPCVEGRYDIDRPASGYARRLAFGDWLHETVGIAYYRMRGWL